jgi:hypothetical protein
MIDVQQQENELESEQLSDALKKAVVEFLYSPESFDYGAEMSRLVRKANSGCVGERFDWDDDDKIRGPINHVKSLLMRGEYLRNDCKCFKRFKSRFKCNCYYDGFLGQSLTIATNEVRLCTMRAYLATYFRLRIAKCKFLITLLLQLGPSLQCFGDATAYVLVLVCMPVERSMAMLSKYWTRSDRDANERQEEIARQVWSVTKYRCADVAIALHNLRLSVLEMVYIFDTLDPRVCFFVPFHCKWNLACAVKHLKKTHN